MRTQHILLLSIALSIPAMAAEPKSPSNAIGKSGDQATSRADAAKSTATNDEVTPIRPARKNRVRYTFPPSAKRM